MTLGTCVAAAGSEDHTRPVSTAAGRYLRAIARDESPAGGPERDPGGAARRIWDHAFRLAVRRRFMPDSPLAEISRTVATAADLHAVAALPLLEAEMLVRDALGEAVPIQEIDPAVLVGVHVLLFAALADEMALGGGELDGLIAQAEALAATPD